MPFVSITRLRVRYWRYLPGFLIQSFRTTRRWRKTDSNSRSLSGEAGDRTTPLASNDFHGSKHPNGQSKTAEATVVKQQFDSVWAEGRSRSARGTESLQTLCWRGESRANSSRKWISEARKKSDFQRFLDDSGLLKSGFARKSPREYEPRSAVGRSAYLHLSSWFN